MAILATIPITSPELQRTRGCACCAETNFNIALGKAEGERTDRLRRAKERVRHKYGKRKNCLDGTETSVSYGYTVRH